MAGNQARFTRQYTDVQKDALLSAVILDGLTVAEAVRRANAGTLGLPAFKLDRLYAYQLVKQGREAFRLRNPAALHKTIDTLLTELAGLAVNQAEDVVARAKKGDIAAADIKRAISDLKAAKAGLERPQKPKDAPTDTPAVAGDDVLTRLLGQAAA